MPVFEQMIIVECLLFTLLGRHSSDWSVLFAGDSETVADCLT